MGERVYSEKDIERVLFTEEQIRQKVAELGRQISKDYAGKQIVAVPLLKGAGFFTMDLLRQIDLSIPTILDPIMAGSYGDEFVSSVNVKIVLDLHRDIRDRDVLLIEDIVDTGGTLDYLIHHSFLPKSPRSLRVCTFLDKPSRRREDLQDFKPDYFGFRIDNHFVVGYGMDMKQQCRNWPFIAILKEECYSGKPT